VPGVSAVSVDLAAGTACVHAGKGAGCPTMFVSKMLAALEEGGYPARVEGAEGGVEVGGSETGGGMSSPAPFQVADGGCEGGGSAPGFGGEWGLDVNWEQVGVAKTRETHTAPGAEPRGVGSGEYDVRQVRGARAPCSCWLAGCTLCDCEPRCRSCAGRNF
jgi:hypothetical protein